MAKTAVSPTATDWPRLPPFPLVTTFLVVDDHPTFRRTARTLLESEGFEVVGEAVDGASAIEAAASLQPDVVLLDVYLPDMEGFEVATLAGNGTPPAVILTSSREASDFGPLVERSGAVVSSRKRISLGRLWRCSWNEPDDAPLASRRAGGRLGAAASALMTSATTGTYRVRPCHRAHGGSFITAGLIARTRRPLNRTGLLMIAVGSLGP